MYGDRLYTLEDLARRWGASEEAPLDRRTALRIVDRLGILAVRLGHKTVRYRPEDVDDAERAAQTTGIGQRQGRRSKARATHDEAGA